MTELNDCPYIIIVVRALPDFLRSWSHPISVRPGFRSSGARFSGTARFRVRRERYAAVFCRRAAVGTGFGGRFPRSELK